MDSGITPLPTPFMIQVEPTDRCNLNCQFCWRRLSAYDLSELPEERWLAIADEICSLQIPRVVFSGGGEPLLRKRLILSMMERFRRGGIEGDLLTNGTCISADDARRIVEMQWESVQISIHAPTEDLHDAIAGKKGAFNLSLRGIKNINRYKHDKKSILPKLTLRIVIFKPNFSTLREYIQLAKSLEVKTVNVRLGSVGKGKEQVVLSEDEWRQFKNEARDSIELANQIGISVAFDLFEMELPAPEGGGTPHSRVRPNTGHRADIREKRKTKEKGPSCPLPFSELYIYSNGTASPCPHFQLHMKSDREEPVLDYLEDVTNQSIEKMWREGFSSLRNMFSEKELCPTCTECSTNRNYDKGSWPDPVFYQMFEYFKKRKLYEKGIRFGQDQLKPYPDCAVLHHYLGEFHMESGEYEVAIHHLREAAELEPVMEWTRFSLGKCYFLTGRYEEAEESLRMNLELTSNPLSHFHSWFFLAMAADARRDRRKCWKALQSLEDFKKFMGMEIPLEREFLSNLEQRELLPAWLGKQKSA